MQLRLYDTLTREKRPFTPLDPENVRMYVCGPTVYDFAHIGNARPIIVFDVLFRLLRHFYGADHVTYVCNITDVVDKINARAARDFPGLPLNEAIRKVTEVTAAQFNADVTALGSLPPTFEPRATDFVGAACRRALPGALRGRARLRDETRNERDSAHRRRIRQPHAPARRRRGVGQVPRQRRTIAEGGCGGRARACRAAAPPCPRPETAVGGTTPD